MQHIKTSWYRLDEAMILGPDRDKIWQQGDVWYDVADLSNPLSDKDIAAMTMEGGFCKDTRDALHTRKSLASHKSSKYPEV